MLNLILRLAYNDFKSNRGYDILLFYRHREPSGLALALREAIPPLVKRKMACTQDTTRGGPLRNPHTGHASLAVTIIFPVLSFQLPAFLRKWYHSP